MRHKQQQAHTDLKWDPIDAPSSQLQRLARLAGARENLLPCIVLDAAVRGFCTTLSWLQR